VLALYDANGKEVAYDDDYRFKPDPTIFYEVPKDGEYVLAIYDSIYRGREDFVYRITAGECVPDEPFPIGDRWRANIKTKGWIPGSQTDAGQNAGRHPVARRGQKSSFPTACHLP
jgi:hypothetical protein